MLFSIPIFIEERSSGPARPPTFIVRPLFHPKPVQRAEKLSRALTKLSNELHQLLRTLGDEPRHDELAEWAFNPLLDETTLELRLELASGSHRRPFFFAGYAALDRRLYFTPTLPWLRFEVLPGQSLAERATAVLTRQLRDLERVTDGLNLDDYALPGKARLTSIDIALQPAAQAKKPRVSTLASLFGGEEKKDGERELRRTGRPLHGMYPDDLERAVGREREVEELARLLAAADRRPILLVGPRLVGKTALLHELTWQMCARKKERFGGGRELWLVSPMRLISGMSYLGEWENRVLAILDYAKKKDRVLYFDDLPGLFAAGVSSASDLNVAQVLKPVLEKRSVRVIAEITPEAWRRLRERDRAFADLFHVIPVHEPPEPETLRILVNVARHLEEEHRCAFDLEAVPSAYELHRRFVSDAAFPGKAAGFLRRLAVRFAGGHIIRRMVLEEFRQHSGLHIALLDDRSRMERKSIVERLRDHVLGQDHALEAFADILVTLKARLNDPRRPLGTLLMVGPTGVGKTQAARALAKDLFGNTDRLLRFDMNEYVDGGAVSRLTGTASEPEGLLTSAVRRQPFSVVLFDEIEKAAPEVFDLLLAVLDEGRLTDSLGRVADFTQAVILLTSNLGVREAGTPAGFGAGRGGPEADDAVYTGAAEKFFRPEFFNRLDRVIPFRPLSRERLEGIARQLLGQVLARDGLRRRDALLNVTAQAMARLVDLGYHPRLGARALKRVVEREVAQPMAAQLTALPPGMPMVANLAAVNDGFALSLHELRPVARSVFWIESATQPREPAAQSAWTAAVLDAAYVALDRIEAELESEAPSGKIELANLPVEHARYFFCREQLKKADRLAQAVERSRETPRRRPMAGKIPRPKPTKLLLRQFVSGTAAFDRQREAIALRQDLTDLEPELADVPDSPLTALLRELALLHAMAAKPVDDRPALLVFRACLANDSATVFHLAKHHSECLGQIWGASASNIFKPQDEYGHLLAELGVGAKRRIQAIFLKGLNLRRFIAEGTNTILTRREKGMGVVLVTLAPVASEAEAKSLAQHMSETIDTLEPDAFGPVIQRVTPYRTLTDYRTGLVISGQASAEEFRALFLSALPLPPEVEKALAARTRHH